MNVKELSLLVEQQAAMIEALAARIAVLEAAPKQAAKAPFVRKADPAAAARKAEFAKFSEFARAYAQANGGCTAAQAEEAYKASKTFD